MSPDSTSTKALPLINVGAFITVLVVNGLSNGLPLNGRTAAEISDALPSYFTPAGYTFSIWGIIYLALLGFVVFQALPSQRGRPFMRQVGWLFVGSCAANAAWIFAWHFGAYAVSVVLMVSLLLILAAIYWRLQIGRPRRNQPLSQRILVHVPFSLYLSWISVATIANIASVLGHYGWNGFGVSQITWSAIMIMAGVLIAGVLLLNRRDVAYAAVLIWAFMGIRSAHFDVALVANSALVAAVLVLVLAVGISANTTRAG